MACSIVTFKPQSQSIPVAVSPVVLFDRTVVAGSSHVRWDVPWETVIAAGTELFLEWDEGNPFDPWACEVRVATGLRIGYVSCECNQVVGRLLVAGRDVRAFVVQAEAIEGWVRIEMEVVLYD